VQVATPTPQSKPVTHASRLVAQDIAPLVAFGLGPGILAAGPTTYRHYSYRGPLCKPDLNSLLDSSAGPGSGERGVPPTPRGAAPITLEGDNQSMTLADAQQHRLLELLRKAGNQPIGFAELHAGGISFPAAVVSELELNGYPTERVYDHGRLVGVRLLQPEPGDTPAAHRQRRQHR